MAIASIRTTYTTKARPAMKAALGVENPMALPRIEKVVINAGIGKILKDTKKVEEILSALEAIAGQKPVMTKAKKAIAGFKIREGLEVGVRVTLHGRRMWDFLDRLVHTALPRIKDFQGIAQSAIDTYGNCHLGFREHIVFPEIVPEKVQYPFGFQVTIVTTARDRQQGEVLFRSLGFPLQKNESDSQQ